MPQIPEHIQDPEGGTIAYFLPSMCQHRLVPRCLLIHILQIILKYESMELIGLQYPNI